MKKIDIKDVKEGSIFAIPDREDSDTTIEELYDNYCLDHSADDLKDMEVEVEVYEPVRITSEEGKKFLKDTIEDAIHFDWVAEHIEENYPESCPDMYDWFFAGKENYQGERLKTFLEQAFQESNFIDVLIQKLIAIQETTIRYDRVGILSGYSLQDFIKENPEVLE
jgi:hypothetical protein